MTTIKELMADAPQSCRKSETIQSAANQMEKSNVGFLPVVDENQKVIGTVTDRDIALAVGRAASPGQTLQVQEVMSPQVYTVHPDDDATAALKIMRTKQIGRLPVVDSEHRLKGVVSLMGITRKITSIREKDEFEHKGKENIINTLRSIAERNHHHDTVKTANP